MNRDSSSRYFIMRSDSDPPMVLDVTVVDAIYMLRIHNGDLRLSRF